MAFRVEITEEAEHDAKAILDWLISEEAGEAGLRWFQRLKEAIASLDIFPGRCPLAPENKDFPFEVRHLLYGRRPHVYRVIFRVEDGNGLHSPHPPRTPPAHHQALRKTPALFQNPRHGLKFARTAANGPRPQFFLPVGQKKRSTRF
jgi:toxin ParE1/3/4